MSKPQSNSTLRTPVSTAVAIALIGVVMLAIGAAVGMIKKSNARSENRAFREALQEDPIALRLRRESEQRCDPAGREFYWICGVVIEAKPSAEYGYCSTPERPLYYGALDTESQADLLGDLKFDHLIRVSGHLASPTNSETPYAYPNVVTPQEITTREPEVSADSTGLNYNWVNYDGLPVLFASGSRSWRLTPEERSTLPVAVIFKHPDLPLRVVTSIPKKQIADWRTVVATARSEVSEAVISFDAGQTCSQPPDTVRFLYNVHNIGKLEALRDWVRDNHNLTRPEQ